MASRRGCRDGAEEVLERPITGRGEGLLVLVALCHHAEDLGCVEARDFLGARDFCPGCGDVLDVRVGYLDEVLYAGDGDVFNLLLTLELLGCDITVSI